MMSLTPDLQELVLSFAQVPSTALVCRSMRDMLPRVYTGLVTSGDVRVISELPNRSLVLELIEQFGPEIVKWCQEVNLSIVHLLHPKIKLDRIFCELLVHLTAGFAYELLPLEMRDDTDIVRLALHASEGRAFMFLGDSLQTNPEIYRICLELLQLPSSDYAVDDGSFSVLAVHTIIRNVCGSDFPGYSMTDPLYHRRRNQAPELGLSLVLGVGCHRS